MAKFMRLYASTRDAVDVLEDVEAGRLMKSLLRYLNNEDPVQMSDGANILYLILKQQIDRESNFTHIRG